MRLVNQKYRSSLSYELNELLKSSERIIELTKGTYLFQEGLPAKEIYILISGKVQISKMNAEGKELSLRLCKSGDIVGELTLFTQDPRYLFNAKVVENGNAAVVNIQTLEKSFFNNSQHAFEFLRWMNDHIRKTITKFRDLVLNGKKGALYSTLIRLSNSYGISQENGILIDVPMTNQDLANFCGTARESVSRMLSDLRDKGIISVERKKIFIHNIEYLKKEIDCENCPIEFCNIE